MATPRETLKYYFRKYALPTEQQFAELIDAFVHKDEDILTQEKIDGLISELAGKVSKETFESFKTEIQNLVTEAGGGYDSLAERMSTMEDNVSGHETRIKTLEDAPKGNFVERCPDLDAYTEAEDGKIVMYDGETNEKYHRGWFYERKEGEKTIPAGNWVLEFTTVNKYNQDDIAAEVDSLLKSKTFYKTEKTKLCYCDAFSFCFSDNPQIGDLHLYVASGKTDTIIDVKNNNNGTITIKRSSDVAIYEGNPVTIDGTRECEIWKNIEGQEICINTAYYKAERYDDSNPIAAFTELDGKLYGFQLMGSKGYELAQEISQTSWQPVMFPVVS